MNSSEPKNSKVEFDVNDFEFLDDLDEMLTERDMQEEKTSKKAENQDLTYRIYKTVHSDKINGPTEEEEAAKRLKDAKKKHMESGEHDFFQKKIKRSYDSIDEAAQDLNADLNIEELDQNIFSQLKDRVVDHEASFFAFLNIEFNILNKKMINCSRKCFANLEASFNQAELCANNCRLGINTALNLTLEQQNNISSQLQTCLQKTKNFEGATDRTNSFVNCYEELIKDMDKTKATLRAEFVNYI